jgi:hypothetical protein
MLFFVIPLTIVAVSISILREVRSHDGGEVTRTKARIR